MCGDAFILLQSCLALSVPLGSEILSSYFFLSQYVLPFRMALLHMIAILVRLVMGVCDSVERLFILLLSVFLRFEGVMDCLSVASAEVYDRSCILSFVCRSSSNWVVVSHGKEAHTVKEGNTRIKRKNSMAQTAPSMPVEE